MRRPDAAVIGPGPSEITRTSYARPVAHWRFASSNTSLGPAISSECAPAGATKATSMRRSPIPFAPDLPAWRRGDRRWAAAPAGGRASPRRPSVRDQDGHHHLVQQPAADAAEERLAEG